MLLVGIITITIKFVSCQLSVIVKGKLLPGTTQCRVCEVVVVEPSLVMYGIRSPLKYRV
jgi:hypothetical protein